MKHAALAPIPCAVQKDQNHFTFTGSNSMKQHTDASNNTIKAWVGHPNRRLVDKQTEGRENEPFMVAGSDGNALLCRFSKEYHC